MTVLSHYNTASVKPDDKNLPANEDVKSNPHSRSPEKEWQPSTPVFLYYSSTQTAQHWLQSMGLKS